MWKAIRLHPWRLEIVPAAAFALTVYSAHICQMHAAKLQGSEFAYMAPLGLGMVSVAWILGMGHNHSWVQSERRKTFDWGTVGSSALVTLPAWIVFILAQMLSWVSHMPGSLPWQLDFRVFCAVLVSGSGLTALLELSRRYVPQPQTSEPPVLAAGLSHYRETGIDWPPLLCAPTILAMAIWYHLLGGPPQNLLMFTIGALVLASLSIRRLTVTPTTLSFQLGFPTRFAVADIVSCVPAHQEPQIRLRDSRPNAFGITDGRCIEITMKNGRIYRLGALRPNHICQLIGKSAIAESPAES